MAATIGKRKREDAQAKHPQFKKPAIEQAVNGKREFLEAGHRRSSKTDTEPTRDAVNGKQRVSPGSRVSLQIVTGSYERVLHGVSASIPVTLLQKSTHPQNTAEREDEETNGEDVAFSDTFLFAAHSSSVRCLAISPSTDSNKRFLATGGSDERVNLYNLSTTPPAASSTPSLPTLAGTSTAENSRNRSLGNLTHHERAITSLQFPTRSKLFSAAEDNTIAIARTRDWTVLSSVKAAIPKLQGRPSGDTAGPGEVPAGVNDFAIHPSQKLMLSVGRGEKCMRLWNLMTGKKAGVLAFDRDLLTQVGEGKYSSGEGRRVLWDGNGEQFIVGFERGAAVFGIDSKPKAVIRPSPPTKLHQMRLLPRVSKSHGADIVAMSTEDGRVLFFATQAPSEVPDTQALPSCRCVAQLGGRGAGLGGRTKDFEILQVPVIATDDGEAPLVIVAGSSDGTLRLWTLSADQLSAAQGPPVLENGDANGKVDGVSEQSQQVGSLIGTLETSNRVTCLGAFVMDGVAEDHVSNVEDVPVLDDGVAEEESDKDFRE